MYVRWFQATQGGSPGATGSAAFDFQGDGVVEAVYLDECDVYVFDGSTGAPGLKMSNSSGTIHEHRSSSTSTATARRRSS